ncbi:hypothetical protein [Hymenobacter lapidiphilus]|uniref:hypothetical protein n=1 Tax=Hymenobacter sp. CCM 8763 TaxID=2303334 RepID=UPI0011C15D95|nr:hypothetical protein [Hymenobacter sp. CCM 8763]
MGAHVHGALWAVVESLAHQEYPRRQVFVGAAADTLGAVVQGQKGHRRQLTAGQCAVVAVVLGQFGQLGQFREVGPGQEAAELHHNSQ